MSLDGFSFAEYISVRKFRTHREVTMVHGKQYVDAARQLSKGQPQEWFDYQWSKEMEARPTSFKLSGRVGLKSIDALRTAAAELLAEFSGDEAGSDQKGGDGAEDSQDPMDMLEELEAEKDQVRHGVSAADGLAQEDRPMAKAKPKAGGGKRKRQEPESEDEGMATEGNEPADLQEADPEMAAVMRRHATLTGKASPCFHNLSVQRIMGGEKLGKALQGATGHVSFRIQIFEF